MKRKYPDGDPGGVGSAPNRNRTPRKFPSEESR